MSSYTVHRQRIPTGLDEPGTKIGLPRLPGETLDQYRLRAVSESHTYGGPDHEAVKASLSRRVGLESKLAFTIDVVLDGDGALVAPDPYVEITSTRLRVYSDFAQGTIMAEVDLFDREGGYWVDELYDFLVGELAGTFTLSTNVLDDAEYRGSHLRISNTNHVSDPVMLLGSQVNDLKAKHLIGIFPSHTSFFLREMESSDLLEQSGDFALDATNGILWTYDIPKGFCTVHYRKFPFQVWWDPVRVTGLNCEDLKYQLYDTLLGPDGEPTWSLLNSSGARIYQRVYDAHPFSWGGN